MMIQKFMVVVQSLAKDRSGATSIEYGLIAATLSVVIIGIANLVGSSYLGYLTMSLMLFPVPMNKCEAKRLCGIKLAGSVESTFCPWTE